MHRSLRPFVLVAMCAVLSGSSAAGAVNRATKGPYLTDLSDGGTTVRFELESAAPATVEVVADVAGDAGADKGRGGAAKSVFESGTAASLHVVRMTGLKPATRYQYVVRVGGAVLGGGRFSTTSSPNPAAPVTFLLYGDNRTDDAAHAAIVREMLTVPSDFVVNTGDMVQDGGNAQNWQTFFDIEQPLLRERPLLAAIGNHELYDDAAGGNFARYLGFSDSIGGPRPYGTVRVGNVRFFFLNGMHGWDSGEERQWLQHELKQADAEAGVTWRFAVVHHSPWSAGPHGPNVELVSAHVPELLASHKVDLLFAGHDHFYERGDAGIMKYLISGGGGAPLYRSWQATPSTRKAEAVHHFVEVTTSADAVRIVARRLDGSILDRCGFTKGGPWDCDSPSPAIHASTIESGATDPKLAPSEDRGPGFATKSSSGASTRCVCEAPGLPSRGSALVSELVVAIGLVGLRIRRADRKRPGLRRASGATA